MTLLGKISLLLNLALSLGFAIWAFAIYTNRIDWTTTKTSDRTGEFAKRDADLQALRTSLTRGEARVDAARTNVQLEEGRIPMYQAWYKDQLDKLRSGKNPVQALVSVDGKVVLDQDGLPKLGPVLS